MPDLARAVARMFGVGFDGPRPPDDFLPLLDRGVGAIVLFRRNVESAPQVQSLCADLKHRALNRELLICMDEEGGRVQRLAGDTFTEVPSARAIGRVNDTSLARKVGELLARELRAVNCDWDLAPVVDVDTNPDNPVIADRSFSADPQIVGNLGAAMIAGLQSSGIAACAKHFPGHGDTWQDSHLVLPTLEHEMERLMRIELKPFEAAIRAGVATIMTSHIIFKSIDADFPATMSRTIIQGILRERLGFDGLIVSDDLEMKAIADNYGIEEVIVRCVNAGVDLMFVCHSLALQHQAIDLLVRAVESGRVPLHRIENANRRIDAAVNKYHRPPIENHAALDVIGCEAHQAVVATIAQRASAASDPTEDWRK